MEESFPFTDNYYNTPISGHIFSPHQNPSSIHVKREYPVGSTNRERREKKKEMKNTTDVRESCDKRKPSPTYMCTLGVPSQCPPTRMANDKIDTFTWVLKIDANPDHHTPKIPYNTIPAQLLFLREKKVTTPVSIPFHSTIPIQPSKVPAVQSPNKIRHPHE